MSFWTAVVAIVLIGAVASVMQARYRAMHGITRDSNGNEETTLPGREAELQREIETLRKRLEVLERITTDERQSRSIAAEIESLRDK